MKTLERRIDSGEPLVLGSFPEEEDASFCVSTAICDNPACTCTEMGLRVDRATPQPDGSLRIQRPEVLRAEVSCDGTGLQLEQEAPSSELTSWLRSRLTEKRTRQWLHERWRRSRGQCGDPAHPSGKLPKGIDSMVFFNEVWPYEFDLVVTHEQKPYLVEDQYCLKPDCLCDEAVVQFNEISDRAGFVGMLRLSTRRSKIIESEPNRLPRVLCRELFAQYGTAVLRERFERMREIARREPKPSTVALSTGAKVGRNATCPCGSGKKYKRCCGRARSVPQ